MKTYVTAWERRGKAIRASTVQQGSYRWMLAALVEGRLSRPTWYRTRKDAEIVAHELELKHYIQGRAYQR